MAARTGGGFIMPEYVTVTERYWGWCTWYPCRKSRSVKKWCYDFSIGRVQHWLVYCRYEGCEGDTLYRWSGACLGWGSGWFYKKRVCFKNKIEEVGVCDLNGSGNAVNNIQYLVLGIAIGVATSAAAEPVREWFVKTFD